jgi:hypothetical protein
MASSPDAFAFGPTHFGMFPQSQLLEAIVDLIKYWRWSRLIVVFAEPESSREGEGTFVMGKII